jgi:hypothetical protein
MKGRRQVQRPQRGRNREHRASSFSVLLTHVCVMVHVTIPRCDDSPAPRAWYARRGRQRGYHEHAFPFTLYNERFQGRLDDRNIGHVDAAGSGVVGAQHKGPTCPGAEGWALARRARTVRSIE